MTQHSTTQAIGTESLNGPPTDRETPDVAAAHGPHSALVDYLTVTFRYHSPREVKALFGGEDPWSSPRPGKNRYRFMSVSGHLNLLFDGNQPGMGVCLEAKGEGCRQLEGEGIADNWPGFLGRLREEGGCFSRLDLALDDRSGLLDMGTIHHYAGNGHYRCAAKRTESSRTQTWSMTPGTYGRIKFGSEKSERMLRFYDKGRQKGVRDHWVRAELVARDGWADRLAAALPDHGMAVVAEAIHNFFEFKDPTGAKQPCRWPTAPWWAAFLGEVGKIDLSRDPKVRTLEEILTHTERQCAVHLSLGEELYGTEWVEGLLARGRERQQPHHRKLLHDARERLQGDATEPAALAP